MRLSPKNLAAAILLGTVAIGLPHLWAGYDLQNLGAGRFTVEPEATTVSYAQTATSLVFNGSLSLGDTLGGAFAEQDWSLFSTYALRMTLAGPNPHMPFTVEFYDAAFNIINKYQGSTAGLSLATPGLAHLTVSALGTGNFSSVSGMQFTWDADGQINAAVSEIVGLTRGCFTARAPNGVRFLTSNKQELGAQLLPGAAAWSALSDRSAKTDISSIDPREMLRQVDKLPVTQWQYKHAPNRRYLGPMAQDFHATFGLGDDKHIATLDADGVALSALQGLIAELQDRQRRSAAQAKRLAELESQISSLREQLQSSLPPPSLSPVTWLLTSGLTSALGLPSPTSVLRP